MVLILCVLFILCPTTTSAKPLDRDGRLSDCNVDSSDLQAEYNAIFQEITTLADQMRSLESNIMDALTDISDQIGMSDQDKIGKETVMTRGSRNLETALSHLLKSDVNPGVHIGRRTYGGNRRSLFEITMSNSQVLADVLKLVENITISSWNVDIPEKIDSLKHTFDPKFITLFALLTDVALSTSSRIGNDHREIYDLMDYFRPSITFMNDTSAFEEHMESVLKWYTPLSCLDYLISGYKKSGLYTIKVPSIGRPIQVFCDQTTDGGGWLVIQRRYDGSENFYRTWSEYKDGFGPKDGEFWIGNDILHALTKQSPQILRVDLTDFDNVTAFAEYTTFAVAPESENYTLAIGGFTGTAGDSLAGHNGSGFSTKDRDNDSSSTHCAVKYHGAWWYYRCHTSNLNGNYYNSKKSDAMGVTWYRWKNDHETLKKTEMKLKPNI